MYAVVMCIEQCEFKCQVYYIMVQGILVLDLLLRNTLYATAVYATNSVSHHTCKPCERVERNIKLFSVLPF